MITTEQWQSAQLAERKAHDAHTESDQKLFDHYAKSYDQYFNHVGLSFKQEDKKILEIGPADFPALAYCHRFDKRSMVIEPMPSERLKKYANSCGFGIVAKQAESFNIYEETFDEVWMFNLLQHVQDPSAVVTMAKKYGKVIRFFEPVNQPVDQCHLWTLTIEMFNSWFGSENVKHYPPNPGAVNFHTAECTYGVWRKPE